MRRKAKFEIEDIYRDIVVANDRIQNSSSYAICMIILVGVKLIIITLVVLHDDTISNMPMAEK